MEVAPQLAGPSSPASNRKEEAQPTAQWGTYQRTFFFSVTVTPMQTFQWFLWDWQVTDEEVLGKEPS